MLFFDIRKGKRIHAFNDHNFRAASCSVGADFSSVTVLKKIINKTDIDFGKTKICTKELEKASNLRAHNIYVYDKTEIFSKFMTTSFIFFL